MGEAFCELIKSWPVLLQVIDISIAGEEPVDSSFTEALELPVNVK